MTSAFVQMQIINSGQKVKLKKPPRWLYPNSIEREYKAYLFQIISILQDLTKELLLPRLPTLVASANLMRPTSDGIRSDAWSDDLETILIQIQIALDKRLIDLKTVVQGVASKISTWNNTQFQKTTKQVFGINVFAHEPWLNEEIAAFSRQNIRLIKGMASQVTDQIDGVVLRGIQDGMRSESLAKDITARFGIAKSKAKLIARDQTSKLNGQLTKLRQQSIGVEKYKWITAGDERVRPSHRALNGKIFSWNDPPAEGHPSNAVLCRCYAEPYFEEN